ncbi:hypothetical protein GCM10027405_02950 [Arthrobacter alkaliphilus]|uniref:hypothetical protein n=1 Tax=Arthrobacter alkaliphilus TaxID=369936 RepID=UPI001F416912|nr:hypothetical protein [Arthrobacter alkaliphilus]
MRTTGNVAWDETLEAYKGREAADYVTVVAATTSVCASCGAPLEPGAPLSLAVDITDGTDPDGLAYLVFDPSVCHRQCREPAVTVSKTSGPVELMSVGRQFTLRAAMTGTKDVPVLAYTVDPIVLFHQAGGESISAHVSVLLTVGFRLSLSPELDEILQAARPVDHGVACLVSQQGFISHEIHEDVYYSRQLDLHDPAHTAWLQATRHSDVLVISGDHLDITSSGLDLRAAAHLGTLVTGWVPVGTLRQESGQAP